MENPPYLKLVVSNPGLNDRNATYKDRFVISRHRSHSISPSKLVKVIGVGHAGISAVDHIMQAGGGGFEFIAADTESQALNLSLATIKLTLGKKCSESHPMSGFLAAHDRRDQIQAAFEGANTVFVIAGMGGSTGTGVAPVVAEIAKQLGIWTVGFATKPFMLEGGQRMRKAEAGLDEFSKHLDTLVIIHNDKLDDVVGEEANFGDHIRASNEALKNAVLFEKKSLGLY